MMTEQAARSEGDAVIATVLRSLTASQVCRQLRGCQEPDVIRR